MSVHLAVCGRMLGRCLGTPSSRRALCTPAAAALVGRTTAGPVEGTKYQPRPRPGTRPLEQPGGQKRAAGVRAFREIPHTGRSGWLNLLRFWREGRFQLLHKHMERTFNTLGPIYRYPAAGRGALVGP